MGIYLDNASTTVLRKEVYAEMKPYFEEHFGNPSSLHNLGIRNRKIINQSRKKIASLLNCSNKEIYFTSCGTESINWAIQGIALENRTKSEIVTTRVEHHATLETMTFLEKRGYVLKYVNTDENGFVDLDHLDEIINENTMLVSIIMANNEIGTIQNVKAISEICLKNSVYLHLDAVQALCHTPVDLSLPGIDLVSFSGHKFNAPKGIGILYIKEGTKLGSLLHGGKQENDKRAGTENIAFIVGITKALEIGLNDYKQYVDRLNKYSNYIIDQLNVNNIDYILNGPEIGPNRLPGNINISFKELDGDTLTFYLNKEGLYVSTGSACDSTSIEPSHVVSAIGVPENYIDATLRITSGYQNTFEEIKEASKILIETIKKIKDV